MSKIAVIYWSGTGNTKLMAEAALAGAKDAGAEAEIFEAEAFDRSTLAGWDGFLFGCPAMGDEELEEGSFEPFFAEIEGRLKNIPVGLFGSYGWGGGAWMRIWESRVKDKKANLVTEGVIAANSPDEAALEECRRLGATLVGAIT